MKPQTKYTKNYPPAKNLSMQQALLQALHKRTLADKERLLDSFVVSLTDFAINKHLPHDNAFIAMFYEAWADVNTAHNKAANWILANI